jgi:hypothetical protein
VEVGTFRKAFPAFQLKDDLVVGEGRDVMTGVKYTRHKGRATTVQDSKSDSNSRVSAKE